jgi:hypothetical protein
MRTSTWIHALLAGLVVAELVAGVSDLSAQQSEVPVAEGERVRVTKYSAPDPRFVGSLASWSADSLNLFRDALPDATIPLSDVAKLEISRGMHGHASTGALIGGGIGAVIGLAAVISAAADDNSDDWVEISPGEAALGGLMLTGLGAGVGALIGLVIRTEEWEEVPLR